MGPNNTSRPLNFIEEIIEADNAAGKWGVWADGRPKVHTRFPPEPNGYLHIGHAKSICLNFGLAEAHGGKCNLRFDDTNPVKEEQEYIDSIIHDVRWLGFRWPGAAEAETGADRHANMAGVCFASDYFQQMYEWAVELIRKGRAFVCDLTADQTRAYRGTLTAPGHNSPFRERSVAENLDLFERMKAGEFPDGARTLRAKIDMAHANMNLRDPVMYRILHARHPHTGEDWCIYPMYDWAHGLEDSIEGITHSICTLEFEDHRPLYDWFIDAINEGRTPDGSGPWGRAIHHPQQIEFARLELNFTVMSKRKLLELVKGGIVRGWDDPRMPTLAGMRRRGYPPQAIRNFCRDVGVAKFNSTIDFAKLEFAIRDELNRTAPRAMAVLRPLRVVIENYPPDGVEELDAVNNPEDASAGTRQVPFSRELYVEREDFMENPPKQFFRLAPGREVRLRYAYFMTCREVVKDPATGEVVELRCTYDPATRGGDAPDGRKPKATLHWVSASHALDAEVRLYDHLFLGGAPPRGKTPSDDRQGASEPRASARANVPRQPDLERKAERGNTPESDSSAESTRDWRNNINPDSLVTLAGGKVEPSLASAHPGDRYQFERQGYFCVDPDSAPGRLIFNRTVTLKDTWAKIEKKL